MRAQDLRIGNYVSFKNRTDCYCTVNELAYSGGIHLIRTFTDGTEDDQPEVMADITGIPLTEEWLLKFGFEKSKTFQGWPSMRHTNAGLHLIANNDHFEVLMIGSSCIITTVKYVHQLQNLYFALTGNELTIQ
jgi:hypothetical protein